MKAELTFDLPEEREEFEMAANGWKLYMAISTFDNWLRGKIKHEDLTDEQYEIYDKIRQQLWDELSAENIDIH